jgi:hypothetical protein
VNGLAGDPVTNEPGEDASPSALPGYVTVKNWMTYANCRGVDPEIFFPHRGENQAAAKRICARCEVTDYCLEYALTNKENRGVWGGMSERERRREKQRRRKMSA